MVILKNAQSEIFIVAEVNEEIITNLDIDFEKDIFFKSKLKKLDKNRITEYAKDSLINERIKKIEIQKRFKIIPNETLLSKVIGDIYSSIGISSLSEFESYVLQNDIDIERVKEKISIEIAWNNLIVNIYENEIEINQNAIYKELENIEKKKVDNLLLSEIVFTINDKKELKSKYEEIEKSINEIGFEETARIYSLSKSKESGGNLGWIYKNQLSKEIKNELNNINVGDFTKPIVANGTIEIEKNISSVGFNSSNYKNKFSSENY